MSADRSIEWLSGEAGLCEAIEGALSNAVEVDPPLHRGPQRVVHRVGVDPGTGRSVAVKLYGERRGLRRLRDGLKRRAGRSAADREWAALATLMQAGLSVPTPRARGRLVGRGWATAGLGRRVELVAMSLVDGVPFAEAHDQRDATGRIALVTALADTVSALHRAGWAHGDLHVGNLLIDGPRITLLDLQRVRPLDGEAAALEDWARLCFSLERATGRFEAEAILRDAAALGPELDEALVRFLRDHQRGRLRRHHRIGAKIARLRIPGVGRGRRRADGSIDDATAQRAFEAIRDAPVTDARRGGRVRILHREIDGRAFVVKAVSAGGVGRALADRFRGSAAHRAFDAGFADALVSGRSAPVLAWVERRRLGFPVESWLLMESVGEIDLDAFVPGDAEEARSVAFALADWLATQHGRGLGHADAKAGNLRLARDGGAPRFWWLDSVDLRGPARLADADRQRAWVQLNASLADEAFDGATRCDALARYAERLPFSQPIDALLPELVRASRARGHRWRGDECRADTPAATDASPPSSP